MIASAVDALRCSRSGSVKANNIDYLRQTESYVYECIPVQLPPGIIINYDIFSNC